MQESFERLRPWFAEFLDPKFQVPAQNYGFWIQVSGSSAELCDTCQ